MNRIWGEATRILVILAAAMLTVGPALADKPEGKGKGKGHEKSERPADSRRDNDQGRRDKGGSAYRGSQHFSDQHRVYVRDYYGQKHSRGFCPPGLAKKNNGCMPPGQAKKWQVGRPLPREVIFHDLPPRLVVRLGVPPAGHRYVRVAADILLIATGTGMVIDAIQDLGRL